LYPTNIVANGITPADAERAAPYHAFLRQTLAGVEASMSGSMGPVPNPQEVADAIAKLIATPAGQRPLRTVVGLDGQREGPLMLNATSDQVIQATRQAFGWEPFTTLPETQTTAS
jgi:hypothetical protein